MEIKMFELEYKIKVAYVDEHVRLKAGIWYVGWNLSEHMTSSIK